MCGDPLAMGDGQSAIGQGRGAEPDPGEAEPSRPQGRDGCRPSGAAAAPADAELSRAAARDEDKPRVFNMSRVLRESWASMPGPGARPVLLMAGALVGAMLARGIVYVGREHARTGLPRSWLGNPYIVGRHGDREVCIARYRGHLARMIEPSSVKRGWLAQMHVDGVSVACWCAPHPCHGSVVLEAAAACAAGDGVAWARAQLAGAAEAVADAVLYGMRAPRPVGGGVDAGRFRAIRNNGTEAWL